MKVLQLFMSTAYIVGILNGLKLLLFLPVDHFITSSEIRSHFPEIHPTTMNAKLRKLKKDGLIEVQFKEKLDRAGDDRQEYRLTKNGVEKREELVAIALLVLENRVKKIVESKVESEMGRPNEVDKNDLFRDFLMEFAEKSVDMVEGEVLKEQQEILAKLLNSYFRSL